MKSTMVRRIKMLESNWQKIKRKSIDKYRDKWEEEVQIVGGIPLNPAYMDGVETDRYGNKLTNSQQDSLMWYREEQRKLWKKEKDNG